MKRIRLRDGTELPAIGQGTYRMGENPSARAAEIAALRLGIELGLTLIDTAEMYGDGGAEEVVAEAIAGQRERVFVVTKVLPQNATRRGVPQACAGSLKRLRTNLIDLYLLHWSGSTPLSETITAFEKLRGEGKIRHWGVSNFDLDDLAALDRSGCATDQVLYNLESRGIEYDLLPWCQKHRLPVMAYSPVGHGRGLLRQAALTTIARRHQATAAQVALAWVLRQPNVIAIPKASALEHVRANAGAMELRLTQSDLAQLDTAFPPPNEKRPLGVL
jgi:diketogulonate reductase-like aldo/keto reductase